MSFTAPHRPAHSDFLVHWTGKDIDRDDHEWNSNATCKISRDVADRYLTRLKSILRHGLWMMRDDAESTLTISGGQIARPTPYRTCFTELRLSEVRNHATRYGRLGIGFNRFFLFERMGSPMIYFQEARPNWYVPPGRPIAPNNPGEYFTAFLKPMTETPNGMLDYVFYNESEWRIIFDDEIDQYLRSVGKTDIAEKFTRAESITDAAFQQQINGAAAKPGFLLPVFDKWLALII